MINPKILILPDIHGRKFYSKALYEAVDEGAEIVCLGDYLDPYRGDNLHEKGVFAPLKELVDVKKQHPDRMHLLIGNHDSSYMLNRHLCEHRYDYKQAPFYQKFFRENYDLFGKRVLTFVYVLAAVFAASVLFQVFTKYVYEEGFSTADALVATVVHTFTKIWGGILYGVLPAFGLFVVLYVIAKCIRNKNLRLKAEAEAVQKAEDAKAKAIVAELENKETPEGVDGSTKTTMAPIDVDELSRYFKTQFKGIGYGENYIPVLVKELEFIRRTNPTNVGRAASMIYDSKHMTKRPTKFSDWMRNFYKILDVPLPADLAQTRYKPTEEIRNRLYFM